MNPFARKELPVVTPPATGSSNIRAALRAKGKKINLAPMARDLALPVNTLEGYADSSIAKLSPAIMQKIVGYIWTNGTTYDAENDLLVAPDKPATLMGKVGERWSPPPDFVVATPQPRTTPLPPPVGLAGFPQKRGGWAKR